GPLTPPGPQGSRKRRLIPLDDALSAGAFQAAAELRGLVGRPERSDHGAVIDALLTQVRPFDQRRTGTQYRGELTLQGPERRLGVGFVPLRRDLARAAPPPGS